jgi:hypothetical protein
LYPSIAKYAETADRHPRCLSLPAILVVPIRTADRGYAEALDAVTEARRLLAADPRVSPDLARRLLTFDEDAGLE